MKHASQGPEHREGKYAKDAHSSGASCCGVSEPGSSVLSFVVIWLKNIISAMNRPNQAFPGFGRVVWLSPSNS